MTKEKTEIPVKYDAVIVGGGIAGLTAAAFLSKEGRSVLLCEKESKVGGLVNTFSLNGFSFDGGIRATENSGVLHPMLARLGIDVTFVSNNVSIGIEDSIVTAISKESLEDYRMMLKEQFPDNTADVDAIICEITMIMKYMDILYGIDNPIFMDMKKDRKYLLGTILPWLFKYIVTIGKIRRLQTPVDEYLGALTDNQVLIDIIAQHFFKKTPTFFALSYFSLYLDYRYPKGGTGALIGKIADFISGHKGDIRTDTKIIRVDAANHIVTSLSGEEFTYDRLIWASDMKRFYEYLDLSGITEGKILEEIRQKKALIADKTGGDSVITTYLTIDLDKSRFENICSEHLFYTPVKQGLSGCPLSDIIVSGTSGVPVFTSDKASVVAWLEKYYASTTYEISCPVMRDVSMAPEGKTGLIVSTLMEHSLVKHIESMGWYDEFKEFSHTHMLKALEEGIFYGITQHVTGKVVATPLSIEKLTGNSDGAITGWAFTNKSIPAVSDIAKVMKSVLTPVPDIYQAGQWTYSPSGFPISIMTGKIAADKVLRDLKRS